MSSDCCAGCRSFRRALCSASYFRRRRQHHGIDVVPRLVWIQLFEVYDENLSCILDCLACQLGLAWVAEDAVTQRLLMHHVEFRLAAYLDTSRHHYDRMHVMPNKIGLGINISL